MAQLFVDGEPLDISNLNKLVEAINKLETKQIGLDSQTQNYTPIVWADTIKVTHQALNATGSTTIDYTNANFKGKPRITATPRYSNMASGGGVDVFVSETNTSTSKINYVKRNANLKGDFYIDWIAVYMEPNT